MVGRGEEIRLILRFGLFLGSGIRNPHSLQALKKTIGLLPECICPFPEDELINSFGKPLPTFSIWNTFESGPVSCPGSCALDILLMDVCHMIL